MMLETWILVIEIYAAAAGEGYWSSRTRDLPEAACLTLVQEVKSENTIAYCYRTGETDPGVGSWAWGWRERLHLKDPVCAHTGGTCAWPLLPGRRRI